jgi:hypothetical protein
MTFIIIGIYLAIVILVYMISFAIACRAYKREKTHAKFTHWYLVVSEWSDITITCAIFWPIFVPLVAMGFILMFIVKLVKKFNGIS